MSQPVPPIAVVGLSALFPGSSDVGGFWRDILAGRDLAREVPPSHWLVEDYFDPDPGAPDRTYCQRGAFLDPVPFDPLAFGIPPSSVPATDTAQLLALIVAKQVLEDATQGQFARVDKSRVSVILGVTGGQELMTQMASRLQRPVWLNALRESGIPEDQAQAICERIAASYVPLQESTFPGLLGNVVAGRIANRFDLGGTNCIVDAACGSSLSAVNMALQELYLGQADMVISGGVDTFNDITMFMCFSKTPALSPTGDCRPFSSEADGTLLGEGLGMVALKRLADAERDGDRIYAVLRGVGSSSDGRALSIYAPSPEGQAVALRRTYEAAGYGPETVELLEAHGTGTKAGDVAEFKALRTVFEESGRWDRGWCALGSIKSQIGHTKAAAGAAGLIKTVLALHHRVLPPTIKVREPNPQLDLPNSPFYLNTAPRPWIREGSHPRRASGSAFGFGGSNFHFTMEEYVGPAPRPERIRSMPSELVLLSALSGEALADRCRAWAAHASSASLSCLARRSQQEFDPRHAGRLAIVAGTAAELGQKLVQAAEQVAARPLESFSLPTGLHYGVGEAAGAIAFLFPGQGSQYVGMGADLAMALDSARAVWDRAAGECWDPDVRLHEVVFPRPVFTEEDRALQSARLRATEWAQPAIGAVSLAMWGLLRDLGVEPACMAGHSFGELTALSAAGVLEPADLLSLARRRGELMASAAQTPGAMLAVSLGRHALEPQLASWGLDVVVANDNSPCQVVLAGTEAAIHAAEARLRDARIMAKRLPVAMAFHSPNVAGAQAPFRDAIATVPFHAAKLPVYSNMEAAPYPLDQAAARDLLAEQLVNPVRFAEIVARMHAEGVRVFVEVGPGTVLTHLVEECLQGQPHRAISLDRKGQHGMTALWNGLGQLAVAGVPLAWERLWEGYALEAEPAGSHPKAFTMSLCGANYGKPYPPPGGAADLAPPNPPRASGEVAALAVNEGPDTLSAYQQALTDAHMTYLQVMERALTDTHLTFLKTMEGAFQAGGSAPEVRFENVAPPREPLPPVELKRTVPAATPQEPTAAAPSGGDLMEVLLEVVSERTGYPATMLKPDMQLEADLGIDSIKRLEILASLQERRPDLPDAPDAELARMRTLGEIAAYLAGMEPSGPRARTQPSAAAPGRFHVREVAAPPRGSSMLEGLAPGMIAVTDDGAGVAQALVRRLTELGWEAEVVDQPPTDARGIICLAGLQQGDVEVALEANREAFRMAQAVAPRFEAEGGLWVSVQDTGGDFGLVGAAEANAWMAGLAGLTKTAALEWPRVAAKAIDLERGDRSAEALAEALLQELRSGGPEREVGLHADGRRIMLHIAELAAVPVAPAFGARAIIVVTGGGRGVTAAATLELARRHQPKLVILGRTDSTGDTPEAREVRSTLESLRAAGSEVRYAQVDVRDAAAVAAALEAIRAEWGPLTGLLHGAGTLADKTIADKQPAQFDRVFDTKVLGLKALLEATARDPLAWICLFSSVVARTGNAGQCDYAMANEILNKVAAQEARRRGASCTVRSLNWGPWEGGMVSPALQALFRRRGIPLIPMEDGARLFGDEWERTAAGAEILLGSMLDPSEPSLQLELRVNRDTFACVDHHRIQGKPIVPFVLALEWFIRAAQTWFPGRTVRACRDLKVLRGIRVSDYEGEGMRFLLTAREGVEEAGQVLVMELRAPDGTPHYSAAIELADRDPAPAAAALPELGPWPERPQIYGDLLFHGPAFQVLREFEATGQAGSVAVLADSREMGWSDGAWHTDPAALDGALQLACLWGWAEQATLSLPTQLESYIPYQNGLFTGPLRCQVHARSLGKHRSVSDIALIAPDGAVVAELRGLEMHMVRSLAHASEEA